jgi:parallel beta-helix repeat protein
MTLDGSNQGTSGSKAGVAQGGKNGGHHNWEITDLVIKNFGVNLQGVVDGGSLNGNGIILDGGGTGHFLARLTLDNNGTPGTGVGGGIYWRANNSLIEHSTITRSANNGILMYSGGGSVYNNIVRHNQFNANTSRNLYVASGNNTIVHDNVFRGGQDGIRVRQSSNKITNNTVYAGRSSCIRLEGNSHIVQKNIALNCGTAIRNDSSGSTISNNLISGVASNIFVNPEAGDFTLKADIGVGATITTISASPTSSTIVNPPPTPGNLQAIAK